MCGYIQNGNCVIFSQILQREIKSVKNCHCPMYKTEIPTCERCHQQTIDKLIIDMNEDGTFVQVCANCVGR